jgi:hypothetical protein
MLIADVIRALPKAELHLHFEGAVPWAMVRAHAGEMVPERPAWWADAFRFEDFTGFRQAARTCLACLTGVPAYRLAAAWSPPSRRLRRPTSPRESSAPSPITRPSAPPTGSSRPR